MTLAALKRRMCHGLELLCTHNIKGPCSARRRIEIVQSNAIAMSGSDCGDKLSWLYWGAASKMQITEIPNGIELRFPERPALLLRYEWIEQPAQVPAG